ncbi:MAG TPA: phosphate acyltransferase, partial [Anaeromyxobacteraceae bacterium]|nr:phosphate acyltransferase [Anaeromyxobacteraceae bacterium]
DGVGFITHGSSDAFAILNAVLRVRAAADAHATEEIARAAARSASLFGSAGDGERPRTEHHAIEAAPPES